MKKGEERRREHNKGTQWCSGITCVLAELRAHYPEHQHKEEEEEEDKQRELHTPRHSTTHNTAQQDMHCRHNKVACRQYPPSPTHTPPFYPTQTITAIP